MRVFRRESTVGLAANAKLANLDGHSRIVATNAAHRQTREGQCRIRSGLQLQALARGVTIPRVARYRVQHADRGQYAAALSRNKAKPRTLQCPLAKRALSH